MEVLHPPPIGPEGNENARSLVLLLKHEDWSMLLTGDLEKEGLKQVFESKSPRIDATPAGLTPRAPSPTHRTISRVKPHFP